MNKRLSAYFSGSVQGVGFRYMAERAAVSLGLSGWVKNTKDGRVELVSEGREASLKEFLEKLKVIFKDYIRTADVEWGKATGEFDTFEIRF